ncbi:MAG: LysR family transcriptional regulator, partial [Sulfitobacter sp.]|nr:LysR family transcriptional regulator [Sulfitobacter sp.]
MNSLKEIMRSPDGGPTPQPVNDNTPPALLFEMIRSFVTMARVLNLSRAVTELKSTRQTVRRHISALEEAMNTDLFVLTDRQYELTETGRMALPDAQDILARGTTWLRGQSFSEGHLQRLAASGEGWDFRQQQQPLGAIWSDPSILLRETFRAWAMSSGQIESSLFSHVRPFLIIYRKTEAGWICVEFGEESVYVNWFGRDFARSSVGRQLRQMPAGEEFSHLLFQAFEEVQATQTARLDHVLTSMPRAGRGVEPVVFQRLIMHGFFPDGSPAVQS